MPRFTVTYEIITPESAEDGVAAERGWHHDSPEGCDLSLREAIDLMGCCENSGRWFSEIDARHDYKSGAETFYSLHPPRNITPSSYRRVARLLGIRR